MSAIPGERRIAIVIPAYQAALYLAEVLKDVTEVCGRLPECREVVVVDDGSSDDTSEVARAFECTVLRHETNRGKGAALGTAFSRVFDAEYDAALTLDADGQHLASEMPRLIEAWSTDVDLVLGTRDHLFAGMGRVRRWSNRLSSRAISFAAGTGFSDVQTGFRLYSRSLCEGVPIRGEGFEAESAVVVRAARLGYRIVTVPIELGFADGRHTSHYRPIIDSLRIAGAVIAARLRTSGQPRVE